MESPSSITRTKCLNGLTVFHISIDIHGRVKGMFGIAAFGTLPERKVMVSSPELAEKIANLLIADFNRDAVIEE